MAPADDGGADAASQPPGGARDVPLLLVLQGPDLCIAAATEPRDGRAGPEVIGRPLAAAFPELATGPVLAAVREAFAAGRPETVRGHELRLPGTDRIRPYDLRVTPVLAANGTVRSVVLDAAEPAGAPEQTAPPAGPDAAPAAEPNTEPPAEPNTEPIIGPPAELSATPPPPHTAEQRAADRNAAAAEQAYAQARDVISAVQNELLPPGVPVLPTVRLAAAYLPAGAETAAGGDWFEAIRLPDGRIGLAVGDVVGHGMTASTAMGQLRVLLRERLMDTGSVPSTLDFLARATERVRGARAATVCLAIIDPDTGQLEYATAGHPPPLLLDASGVPRYLESSGAAPLGLGSGYRPLVDRLAPGGILLMYTDGLLERPGCTLAEGVTELAVAAAEVFADQAWRTGACGPRRLADRTVRRLIGDSGFRDDITVLAAQLRAAPPGLDLLVPARRENLATLRSGLDAWLSDIGVHGYHVQLLQHAVGELAANAVEHAYHARQPGLVAVRARLTTAGDVVARVVDQGRWRTSAADPDSDRGVGLALVTDLVDELRLEHDKRGTTATIRHHPWIPAQSPIAVDLAVRLPRRTADADPFLILGQPSAARHRIRVDGPIDSETAPTLYTELRACTAAGTRDVTVDLTGATHLASAGVAVLHRLCAQAALNNTEMRLYAPRGTPAQMVMSLARLRHHTTDPDGDGF
ncbi:MAG: SpoIIE family protein phosphatase [Catenulispora sp.]